jgi:hypothetical protein
MIWIILLSAGLSAAIISDDCQSVGAWFSCFNQQVMALIVCNPKFEVKHVVLDDITTGDLTMLSVGRISWVLKCWYVGAPFICLTAVNTFDKGTVGINV